MIEIYQNNIDQWEFEIKAKNHIVLAFSMNGYESKKSCLNSIRSLLKNVGVTEKQIEKQIDQIKEVERRRKHV